MFTDSKYYPPGVCTNKINQIFGLLHWQEKLLTEPGLSCVRLHKINFSFIPMFCSFSKYKQTCFSGCNILEPCAKHHSCFFVVVGFFFCLKWFTGNCPAEVSHVSESNHFQECSYMPLNCIHVILFHLQQVQPCAIEDSWQKKTK